MKILIAEDESITRRMLKGMLVKWGYDVVTACDGKEAWEILQTDDAPQLVILDWMMPGMDGVEICRKVREFTTPSLTYIILLTAKDTKEDIVLGLGAGADDYISKPFEREELQARVQVGARVVGLQSALAFRIQELQEALSHIKRLQGILPICMHCHKIRDDYDSWQKLEEYIEEHSDAEFSHGLCPECQKKYYPESVREKDDETASSQKGRGRY